MEVPTIYKAYFSGYSTSILGYSHRPKGPYINGRYLRPQSVPLRHGLEATGRRDRHGTATGRAAAKQGSNSAGWMDGWTDGRTDGWMDG